MESAFPVGFYGKLPCKGDFLQRRVPQEFVDRWDAWLQAAVHTSREQLAERWLEAYLTGPVWRFAMAEGVCGSGTYAGVLLPSVDRVGRYFPLTIVATLDADDCLLAVACETGRTWFDSVESVALHALQAADLDLEEFDAQLCRVSDQVRGPESAESVYLHGLMRQGMLGQAPAQWHIPLASGQSLQRAATVFATRQLERQLRPLAVWWTEGSNSVPPAWLCTRGLPAPDTFVGMLAADWGNTGWTSLDPHAGRDGSSPLYSHDGSSLLYSRDDSTPLYGPEAAAMDPSGQDVPIAQPQVGVGEAVEDEPPVEIVAWHEPISRAWGAGVAPACFVERPDVGLWAVACVDMPDDNGVDAQMVADMLQNVPQSGTLTALVEEIRHSLASLGLDPLSAPAQVPPSAAAQIIVFAARGDECALVCAGKVQAVRCRSSQVSSIVGAADALPPPAEGMVAEAGAEGGSLMDLINRPAERAGTIEVHYEALRPGDAWVLAGAALLDEPRLAELAGPLSPEQVFAATPLTAVRNLCRADADIEARTLPVMLLAARACAGA